MRSGQAGGDAHRGMGSADTARRCSFVCGRSGTPNVHRHVPPFIHREAYASSPCGPVCDGLAAALRRALVWRRSERRQPAHARRHVGRHRLDLGRQWQRAAGGRHDDRPEGAGPSPGSIGRHCGRCGRESYARPDQRRRRVCVGGRTPTDSSGMEPPHNERAPSRSASPRSADPDGAVRSERRRVHVSGGNRHGWADAGEAR